MEDHPFAPETGGSSVNPQAACRKLKKPGSHKSERSRSDYSNSKVASVKGSTCALRQHGRPELWEREIVRPWTMRYHVQGLAGDWDTLHV